MFIYFLVLVLIAVVLFFCYNLKPCAFNKGVAAIFVALILIFVAGFRYNVGTDYPVYINNYEVYKNLNLFDLSNFGKIGVSVVAKLSVFIYDHYATWFFIVSLLTVGIIILAIYKYSDGFCFSILMYLFLGCWHNSFNVVKQSVAIAVILLAQKYLFEGKFFKWTLLCILAATFHISAILLIPIYFLVRFKLNIRTLILMAAIGIAIACNYESLFEAMNLLKMGEGVTGIGSTVGSRSINLLRIAVACAPPVLLLLYRKSFDNSNMKLRIWANFSIFNSVLYLACMNSVYLARFCLYTDAFNMFFIPCLFSNMKKSGMKNVMMSLCATLYCAFWIYDLYKGSTTRIFQWVFEEVI